MYINTFKYKPEDVACVLCAEYVKKLGCTALSCPCLAERMEAGVVGYAEAVAELFPLHPRLTPRILRLVAGFPGSLWRAEQRFSGPPPRLPFSGAMRQNAAKLTLH